MESKILIIIIIFFVQTNSQIKQNPILLINSTEPIDPLVLSSKDEYYYIITSGKDLQIEKESGNIISSFDNNIKTSNYVNYVDNAKILFLFHESLLNNLIYYFVNIIENYFIYKLNYVVKIIYII